MRILETISRNKFKAKWIAFIALVALIPIIVSTISFSIYFEKRSEENTARYGDTLKQSLPSLFVDDFSTLDYSAIAQKLSKLVKDDAIYSAKAFGPVNEQIIDTWAINQRSNDDPAVKTFSVTIIGKNGKKLGLIVFSIPDLAKNSSSTSMILFVIFLGVASSFLVVYFLVKSIFFLIRPYETVVQHMGEIAVGKISKFTPPVQAASANDERASLFLKYSQILGELEATQNKLVTSSKQTVLAQLASQVAHDIRSPLAALDNVMTKTKNIPEDERLLVRSALNRIKDIANNLIERNRTLQKAATSDSTTDSGSANTTAEQCDTFLLPSLIDPLVTEKRMQFRPKLGIEIDSRLDAESYGLFARVQATEFKRLLSNLINNSVEAMGDRGIVTLSLRKGQSGSIEICICDNGKGIPPEILTKLGQRGETHGKEGGSGLGVYHAHTTVKGWGGELKLTSKTLPDPDHGTMVTISLPQALAPGWFVSKLQIPRGAKVVVLDDDPSIHGIWQGRFDSLRLQEKEIEIQHFSTPEEITRWVKDSKGTPSIYLADFELLGHTKTGLDLIEELGIGDQSILVTSRFEEKHVADRAARLNVKLIPKSMAAFVPIVIQEPKVRLDAILIDDDELLMHSTWTNVATQHGKTIRCFATREAFFAEAGSFSLDTPLYIDANLGNGVTGEEVALAAKALGFKVMHLATGYEAEHFAHLVAPRGPLTSVQGKNPPWGDFSY
ncbi:HAMP domain-containing sensor histidine kinase [Bdellovibrionota bacterium FG-2]